MERPSRHIDTAIIETSSRTKASDANSERIVREHAKIIPLGKRAKNKTRIIVAKDTDHETDLR